MVQLVEMPVEKFDAWNERVWRLYRAELIQSGVSPAAADVNVESNIKATMVDGKPAHGNTVFEVLDRDTIVGVVWLNQKDTEWFIYDIEVYEEFRGKGFGRAT
ncbi:MAG: hypothetical protein RL410_499, partial [Actinomycetota bacterium]